MAKFELTKSIEAVKLNPRTMRPLSDLRHTIPFGAMLEKLTLDGDMHQFHYLGEPYECPDSELKRALNEIPSGRE